MIEVLLVDDLRLIRVGIRSLLDSIPGVSVCAEASSGEEALSIIREHQPDVVIMDTKMTGIGGLEATRRIQRLKSNIKVIFMVVSVSEVFPNQMFQAGAQGCITKNIDLGELEEALKTIIKGERYLSRDIAQAVALQKLTPDGRPPMELLTERELQVMMMITQGQKIQEISEKLCLSPKTVCSYRYRIFEKLSVDTDVALTHHAIKNGMIALN